ncbi:unnamed protein product [Durusdinium trenchii]|uniref:Uncharacterized protein n=1 Tax=Durusdinium trenchii TaxID=1381693 RepID=A0ABP0P611_9DINO
MLANPQNLDIGALLQSPSLSPFALALKSSKYMLVVPNRHTSVYTRLWCGYEAYLAFQSNKIIQTAAPPIWRQVWLAWFMMLPALLIGLMVGSMSKVHHLEGAKQLMLLMRTLALLASLVSQNCGQIRLCLIANHIGLASGAAAVMEIAWSDPHDALPLLPQNIDEQASTVWYTRVSMLAYFLLAEIDRLNWQTEISETEQLQNQFGGTIRQAACSQVQDELNIRHEIGDQVDEVDKVIHVLLKAGLTSDALRDAYLRGVELEHAGVVQVAIPAIVLGPHLFLSFSHLLRCIVMFSSHHAEVHWSQIHWFLTSLQASSIFARCCFLTLLFTRPIDERCFMLNAMAKIVAPILFCFFLESQVVYCFLLSLYHLSFLVVLFFAALGIRGTLKLPCGRFFTQVFLSRVLSCRLATSSPDESDDIADEKSLTTSCSSRSEGFGSSSS